MDSYIFPSQSVNQSLVVPTHSTWSYNNAHMLKTLSRGTLINFECPICAARLPINHQVGRVIYHKRSNERLGRSLNFSHFDGVLIGERAFIGEGRLFRNSQK